MEGEHGKAHIALGKLRFESQYSPSIKREIGELIKSYE